MKIIPLLIFLLVIIFIIFIYQIRKNKLTFMWAIIILRICLPIFSIGFFGPIFLFLTTLFDCQNGKSYISKELECRTGDWFIYHSPFVAVAMPLHLILALITNTLYYKSLFIKGKSDVLKKTNSIPDICLLCTKVIIIFIFVFDKGEESEHWALLFLLMVLTGFNAYINIYYKNRLNLLLMLLNIIMSLILFFGFSTLFIGKIFKFLGYNGSIFFYFLGIVIVLIFIIFFKGREMAFVFIDYKSISNPDEYINYIMKFYRIILNKNNTRNNSTLLKSYIEVIEDTCTDNNCCLKKYLEKLKSGVDSEYLLYDYLDKLFRYGISKFKHDAMLKNDYAMFLMVKMNNKRKAIIVLNNIQDEYISFHRNYNIYRCRNLINKWPSSFNSFYFNYRKNMNEFKQLISKTINLYYEFWNLLYESTFNQRNNFNDLYIFGNNIMKLNIKIEGLYNLLIQTKTNNINIFKLYSEYIEAVLKDQEKFVKYKNINTSIYSKSVENELKNYSNFNMGILKDNDKEAFLLLSGRKKDLGTIVDCSISASTVFGYTKEELIGKHMNLFIPDIFHPKHNIIVQKYSKIFNLDLFTQLFQQKEYSPIFTEGTFFGVLKSKFIKPLNLKVYYIKTEDNLISFVVEIAKDIQYMDELLLNKFANKNIDTRCCVLTNENFLISGFTVNSIEQLGLNYRYTKSNNSIIPYIKQLCNDYRNMIYDLNINNNTHVNNKNDLIQIDSSASDSKIDSIKNISPEIKRKIKYDLINKKYNKKCQITWRINKKIEKNIKNEDNNDNNNPTSKCTRISHRGSNYNLPKNKKDENSFEFEFIMEIKKAILDNKLLGYYFYFSKLFPSKTKNFICYNVSEKNDKIGDLKKITKYKTIFKSSQNDLNDNNQKKRTSHLLFNHNNDKTNNEKNKMFEISNSYILSKNNSNIESYLENEDSALINNEDEVIIDERFIPKCKINFSFDLINSCYNCQKDYNDSKLLNDVLYKEAINKINEYQNYLKTLKIKEKESDISNSESEGNYTSESEENSDSDDIEEEEISNANSLIRSNSSIKKQNTKSIQKSISVKSTIKSKIESIRSIKASRTLKVIKEVKYNEKKNNNNNNKNESQIKISSNISDKLKKYQGKNFMNNYYKINLSRIHLMIYDFNKDMVIEGSKNEINYKIENIIINSKKQNEIINIGKDEKYPFISLKSNKDEKNNKNKKIEENNNNIVSTINENKINEVNILSRKINDAINNEGNEDGVKLLHIYSIISFTIMIILALLILITNFYFYNRIKEIIKIIKDIISIKYCNTFSIYCLREITLLNFNFSITGGVYKNFPGKDREKYKTLIKSKFEDYFLETQTNIIEILSSTFSPSKNTEKNLTETFFGSQYISSNKIGFIEADILTTLIQYNAAFYNLATTYTPIYQSHSDMLNFMHNSFNNYTKTLNLLLNKYEEELKVENGRILIFLIAFIIIVLILYIIFCFLVVMSFMLIAKIRMNYMKVFYGINSNSIKNLMIDCEKLMNKLKRVETEKNEEDLEEELEEKRSYTQNKNKFENNSRNMALNNNHDNQDNNTMMSLSSKIFIFFYIIFMIAEYSYFPTNCFILFNISNKSFDYYNFFKNLNTFHSNILNLFNVYREYLFDNNNIIHETTPFEYLMKLEMDSYNKTGDLFYYLDMFMSKNLKMTEEIYPLLTKDFCSYYITDYFNSNEECQNKYSYILSYDFAVFATNFLQAIRNLKNIAKYTYETENIIGELEVEKYNDWEKMKQLEQSGEKFIFRLDLFNNETLHMEMNILYINILLPYLDNLRKVLLKNISLEGNEFLFILFFCIYILLIILIYFGFLIPMIKYLNNSIYKTKKILLLIPMKILASQINIKSLLKLN